MRRLGPLAVALLGSCAEPHGAWTGLAEVVRPVPDGRCDGWRVVGRLEVGGFAAGVAGAPDDSLLVAAFTGLDRLDRRDLRRLSRTELPGEVVDVAVDRDTGSTWVALGTGGLGRVAADGAVSTWGTGGRVVAVEVAQGSAWFADRTGRVLYLPADAPSDAVPLAIEVDGRPSSLQTDGAAALVGTGVDRWIEVELGPDDALVVRPGERVAAGPVTAADRSGGDWWLGSGTRLLRRGHGQETSVDLGGAVGSVVASGGGAYAIARKGGLRFWDGAAGSASAWRPGPVASRPGFVIEGFTQIGESESLVIAAGNGGVALATSYRQDGVTVTAAGPPGGQIRALLPLGDGRILVALAVWNGAGALALVEPAAGGWRVAERIPIVGDPTRLVRDGSRVWVARNLGGLGSVDADHLDAGLVDASGFGPSVAGIELRPDGGRVVVSRDRSVHWVDPEGVTRHTDVETATENAGATAWVGDRLAVVYDFRGRVRLWDGPGAFRDFGLVAAPFDSGASPVVPVGHGGRLWVPAPFVGVEAIDPETGASAVAALDPSVVQVAPFGDRVVAARGTAGIALLHLDDGRVVVDGTCDLPGDAGAVAVDDERVLVGLMGDLWVLERTAP